MRTFLFCTCFVDGSRSGREERWKRWLRYYGERKATLGAERLILIDDASGSDLLKLGLPVVDADRAVPEILPAGDIIFRFGQHLGRSDVFCFPGWWRSFTYAAHIARSYSVGKLIHIESDAAVLTARMTEYLRDLDSGWTSFWCPRYERAESAIQVICRDTLPALQRYYDAGYPFWSRNVCAERELPFTQVVSDFIGDRYGEYRKVIPEDADFATQTTLEMNWLTGRQSSVAAV